MIETKEQLNGLKDQAMLVLLRVILEELRRYPPLRNQPTLDPRKLQHLDDFLGAAPLVEEFRTTAGGLRARSRDLWWTSASVGLQLFEGVAHPS